jgi:DHA2 family multidrug resistance protein-like MFS transporter
MSSTIPQDGLPPHRRIWAVATLVIAVGMASLDQSIANTALPSIAADLRATASDSIWVVNAYQLALVVSLLPLAALGEIHGYRRVYVGGLALFTVASLLCALSWSIPTLTLARVAQGFGASGLVSVNTALIRFIYPSRLLGRGVGLNAMVVGVGTAVGPTIASGLLYVSSWQWLFAVNVPLGAIALLLAWRALPATPRTPRAFDLPSAALNAGTFGLLIFGIGEGAHAAPAGVTAGALALCAVCGWFLVSRQLQVKAPLLPLDLYRRPVFALSSATSVCSFVAQGLAFVALPFYFQTVLGRSAVETGLLFTPWPLMTALMAPIAGPMSDRYPVAIMAAIGMAMLTAGLLLMATLPADPPTWQIVWRMMLCGLGFGGFQSPNLKAILSSAPRERSGGASGIVAMSRLVGQSIGAALVALCLGLAPRGGAVIALALAAGFAGGAGVISLTRLRLDRG